MVLYFIRKEKILTNFILGKAIPERGSAKNVTNENVRSKTASDPYYTIGYKTMIESSLNKRQIAKL